MKASLLCMIACSAINFASAQWTRLSSPTTNNLYAVAFSNERSGFAGGAKGTVLRTNDGGATGQFFLLLTVWILNPLLLLTATL
jgi:photosystem II stability/assembly factor-like uncharacterized protein